jgi:predicted nuclease of restriction endonuclease-like (RecB) superfamily
MASNQPLTNKDAYSAIRAILIEARATVYHAVNSSMVRAYWNIGRIIVEEEQQGKERAEYGKALILQLSTKLTKEFGKGFDASNLKRMRQFYLLFPKGAALKRQSRPLQKSAAVRHQLPDFEIQEKYSAMRSELSWTHYKLLIRIENPKVREWYMNEAADCGWSTRALERQINSFYYERLLASRDKKPVKEEADEKISHLAPENILKDPYVLEFLDLKDHSSYRETELEQALCDKLQDFLLELGKGFSFVARQKRIAAEDEIFFIDLVFYNYLLKCFVLIDLKIGKLTHQDIGQVDMYVRMYEDKFRLKGDNPTIGIILCSEKNEAVAKYSVLNENKHLFASKYQLYLPTEAELIEELKRERQLLEQQKAFLSQRSEEDR